MFAALIPACSDDTSSPVGDDSSTGEDETTAETQDPTLTTTVGADTSSESSVGTTADTSSSEGSSDSDPDTSGGSSSESSAGESSSSEGSSSEGSSTGPTTTCGDDTAEGDEVCDGSDLVGSSCVAQDFDAGELGCLPDCSGYDTSACVLFSCGNDVIEGRESCDSEDLAGQDCLSLDFDGGTLACGDNCTFDTSGCITFACGNDILEGDEICDVGQLSGADCTTEGFDAGELGCLDDCTDYDTSACVLFECGNGVLEGDEICDGTDFGAADCSTEGFDGGTLTCADDCTAVDTAACTSCGDFVIEGDEACEGFDLGGATCGTEGFGGGFLFCDAACGFQTASCFPSASEAEPNDDGATAVATNDFLAGAANGPYTSSVLLGAAIGVAGDDDVFAVTNTFGVPAYLGVETFGAGGPGTCAAIDTFVSIRDAAGVALVTSDDEGINTCSLISSFALTPGQTVYVHVIEFGDNAAIASYFTQLTIAATGCGNGVLEAGELCEDRNVTPGDGCDAACQIEDLTEEVEPNDDVDDADATGIIISDADPYTRIHGSVSAVGNGDFYRIDVAAAGVLRLETFTTLGRCAAGVTTTMRLLDGAGTQLVTDDASGIASCSAIVYPVVPGTYYVTVNETGNNATIASYYLEAAFAVDRGSEVEPNETQVQASSVAQGVESFVFGDHSLDADSDYYAIYVPSGGSLRLETIEGALGTETCESNGVDSIVTLYDSAGVQLVQDDDSGRGFCTKIDGTGDSPASPPAHTLQGGVYYARVRAAGSAVAPATQFVYRLAVTIRTP